MAACNQDEYENAHKITDLMVVVDLTSSLSENFCAKVSGRNCPQHFFSFALNGSASG